MDKSDIQLNQLEKRPPHVVPPWWGPPFTHIAESPEIALMEHDATDPSTLCVYTDGSGIDGHVGAAVVAPMLAIQGIRAKSMKYMGTSTTSTVYAAELKGIEMAFQIALDVQATADTAGKCTVFTDNQAAIQAMANPKCPLWPIHLGRRYPSPRSAPRLRMGGSAPMDTCTHRRPRQRSSQPSRERSCWPQPIRTNEYRTTTGAGSTSDTHSHDQIHHPPGHEG